jgi:hypothetical protein
MGMGDWDLGIGNWGLGPLPTPNPHSPTPNPHYFVQKKIKFYAKIYYNIIKSLFIYINYSKLKK